MSSENHKKVHFNDLRDGTQAELKKTYNLDLRGMEKAVRQYLDGANAKERREFYQQFYKRK